MCQNWSFLGYYEGESRHHPITFSNDRYGFVIAGQNGQGDYLDDVYKYDSQLNTWEQLNNFPVDLEVMLMGCQMINMDMLVLEATKITIQMTGGDMICQRIHGCNLQIFQI